MQFASVQDTKDDFQLPLTSIKVLINNYVVENFVGYVPYQGESR
jgi:hypothetical protein